MATPKKILEVLEDLEEKDFKKFKWYLQKSDILGQQFQPISRGRLENADKMDTVDLMQQTYSENSVTVTTRILVEMNQNDLVKKLSHISQPTGLRSETPQRKPVDGVPAEERLFSVRREFVQRVSEPVLNQLLDELLGHRIITDEEMQNFRRQDRVTADRARGLIDTVRGKGNEASSVLIAALREVDPVLSRELKFS